MLPADELLADKVGLNLTRQRRPTLVCKRQRCEAPLRLQCGMKMPNNDISRVFAIYRTQQKAASLPRQVLLGEIQDRLQYRLANDDDCPVAIKRSHLPR